ncbi:MAG: class I SAM-dependent methyltransferase [Acidimicrobiia bacterium]
MRAAEHRLAARLQRWPRLYRLARSARTALGNRLPVRELPGLGPVHPNDPMLAGHGPGAVDQYRRAGAHAAELCAAALAADDRGSAPGTILDLGCGHGRCLRFLRRRWPDARLVAADVDAAAVRFCAQTFDTEGVVLPTDRRQVPPGPFDLVWVGSRFTHLPLDAAGTLLAAIRAELGPAGVAVVTTHALYTVDNLVVAPDERRAVVAALGRDGFAFKAYRGEISYGLAWFEPARFRALAEAVGLRVLQQKDRTWVGFQDVWVLDLPA